MTVSAAITEIVSIDGGRRQATKSIANGRRITYAETIAGEATNVLVACNLDVSAMHLLFIKASGALTLKTNSSSVPDDTLAVPASNDGSILWYTGCGKANPLTEDVTALYVTNAAETDVVLEIEVVDDPTPP